MTGAWAYTIRVGYADEHDRWLAQILDDIGEEAHVITADSLQEALGQAAVAILDVHDDPPEEAQR